MLASATKALVSHSNCGSAKNDKKKNGNPNKNYEIDILSFIRSFKLLWYLILSHTHTGRHNNNNHNPKKSCTLEHKSQISRALRHLMRNIPCITTIIRVEIIIEVWMFVCAFNLKKNFCLYSSRLSKQTNRIEAKRGQDFHKSSGIKRQRMPISSFKSWFFFSSRMRSIK